MIRDRRGTASHFLAADTSSSAAYARGGPGSTGTTHPMNPRIRTAIPKEMRKIATVASPEMMPTEGPNGKTFDAISHAPPRSCYDLSIL